jgi:hypothetical protein
MQPLWDRLQSWWRKLWNLGSRFEDRNEMKLRCEDEMVLGDYRVLWRTLVHGVLELPVVSTQLLIFLLEVDKSNW